MSITEAVKPETAQGPSYATVDEALAFGRRLLVAHGLSEADAAIMASCLVRADLRGVDTHGICRLPGYLDRVRRGLINARPKLAPKRVTPVAASLDGQDAFGFVVGLCAIKEAMAMARDFGIGIVSVKRSTHFGMAASYLTPAIEAGFIALVFSNASPALPQNTHAMRIIDNKSGVRFFRQQSECIHGRHITFHTKNTFRDQNGIFIFS